MASATSSSVMSYTLKPNLQKASPYISFRLRSRSITRKFANGIAIMEIIRLSTRYLRNRHIVIEIALSIVLAA